MKILIATPAYGDVVYRGYHESVAALVLAFARAHPDVVFEHRLINVPVLATARNILASLVLNDSSFTHLLFIDADMAFSPSLIERMIAFGKPFVGSIYPSKRNNFEAFAELVGRGDLTTLQALMVSADYICSSELVKFDLSNGKRGIVSVDGFVRASAVGTGILLIEREALERIRDSSPDMWMETPGGQIRAWGLEEGGLFRGFDTIVNCEGYHVGEDIAFCLRWTAVGGQIWAAGDEAIVHSGNGYYRGHALIALKSEGKVRIKETLRRSKGRADPWFARVLAAR